MPHSFAPSLSFSLAILRTTSCSVLSGSRSCFDYSTILMSTVVIQGPQSCLDSQLALSHKSTFSHQLLHLDITAPSPSSNPTFEQAGPGDRPVSTSYAPPRTTTLSLGARSLQLCTENLGSESGCDILASEDGIFTLFSSCPTPDISYGGDPPIGVREVPRQHRESTKRAATYGKQSNLCFPPPLTTIRGWESLQIRSHREGGRVVMKAVQVAPERPYFRAERRHGRLRLCFYSVPEVDREEEEDSEVLSSENERTRKLEVGVDDDDGDEDGEGECAACAWEEMGVNSLEIGVEIEMEKFRRGSRGEGGGGCGMENPLSWEPFCVATS